MVMAANDGNLPEPSSRWIGFKDDTACDLQPVYSHLNYIRTSLPSADLKIGGDSGPPMSLVVDSEGVNSSENCEEFFDLSLKYITQVLLEEDVEDESQLYNDSSALQAAENSFYEILKGKISPPPTLQQPLSSTGQIVEWQKDSPRVCENDSRGEISSSPRAKISSSTSTHKPFSYSKRATIVKDGLWDSPTDSVISGLDSISLFRKGREEATEYLLNSITNLINPSEDPESFPRGMNESYDRGKHGGENFQNGGSGRRKTRRHGFELEERARISKQNAWQEEMFVRTEMLDRLLLGNDDGEDALSRLHGNFKKGARVQPKRSTAGGCVSETKKKDPTINFKELLIQCAKAVAADDWRSGDEILRQIKQHSSPYGNGEERLAHYFAQGLEARMAGTGYQIYVRNAYKRRPSAEHMKGFQIYMTAMPFLQVSLSTANQTILDTVLNAAEVHIVDFSITFGFQWPSFLQKLSKRPGGPPKLRITGIDFPHPGPRPSERLEATGHRLADYAQTFGIPFKYTPFVCKKWEEMRVEDLNIESSEVLIVNCLFRFHLLDDKIGVAESPRDLVLKLIRKMNPSIFVHGINNGAYHSPFFMARFSEAFHCWSTWFDLLETTVDREHQGREMFEAEYLKRQIVNDIACEGFERVPRPESFNQWHQRTLRARFMQLPFNVEIVRKARLRVRANYHRNFMIYEDSQWLLQGWKGRIMFAISIWKPS